MDWHSFPYWATGVYAACSGRVPDTGLDPKGLLLMAGLGDLWQLSVLLLYAAALIGIPAGIVGTIILRRHHNYSHAAIPMLCPVLGFLFFGQHFLLCM